MKRILSATLLALLLAGCNYLGGFLNTWHYDCPGFPTREEVETVVEESREFFDMLEKEAKLIHWISVSDCRKEVTYKSITPAEEHFALCSEPAAFA